MTLPAWHAKRHRETVSERFNCWVNSLIWTHESTRPGDIETRSTTNTGETLALAEQEERTVEARRYIYEAEQANADAELDKAIELYEKSFAIWADIFDDYPILVIDDTAEDLYESIERYFVAIDSQEIPEGFPLEAFIETMGIYGQVNADAYKLVREEQKERAEKTSSRTRSGRTTASQRSRAVEG